MNSATLCVQVSREDLNDTAQSKALVTCQKQSAMDSHDFAEFLKPMANLLANILIQNTSK